jgi:hypothetical protein
MASKVAHRKRDREQVNQNNLVASAGASGSSAAGAVEKVSLTKSVQQLAASRGWSPSSTLTVVLTTLKHLGTLPAKIDATLKKASFGSITVAMWRTFEDDVKKAVALSMLPAEQQLELVALVDEVVGASSGFRSNSHATGRRCLLEYQT